MTRKKPQRIVGTFLNRPNRFVMRVKHPDGDVVRAYCPNTSRLIGLLEPGVEMSLTPAENPDRSTDYTVRRIRDNGVWVGIEAARANDLFEHDLAGEPGTPFSSWIDWDREVSLSGSQIDFRARVSSGAHWVEVKSLSSRGENGRAFYSGTPSRRAQRHLRHLGGVVPEAYRVDCVFVVQRSDVSGLAPGEESKESWLKALRSAREQGVNILAYRCADREGRWAITDRIPVEL